jgi:hypothetical protein
VIALDPDDPFAYTSQSIFLQRKGQIPEAEKAQAKARMASWKQELKKEPERAAARHRADQGDRSRPSPMLAASLLAVPRRERRYGTRLDHELFAPSAGRADGANSS